MPDAPLNPDALDMHAYDEALLAFKKVTTLYPGQAVALKDAVMAYAKHLTVALAEAKAVAWEEGFQAGWKEHEDPGAFVNDFWDAKTPNPYRPEGN